MKTIAKILAGAFLLTLPLNTLQINAQAPENINYQAAVRNSQGEPIGSKEVEIEISILQGDEQGTEIFTEHHLLETNQFGLVNLKIGSENNAHFSDIDWAQGPYFLQVSVDGILTGTSQLLSVPYALHSETSGDGLPNGTQEGNTLFWDGKEWVVNSSNLYNSGETIGISTNTPKAQFHLDSNNGFLVTGNPDLNDTEWEELGHGPRMFFYPAKAAFRAGTILYDVEVHHWDDEYLGENSAAFGISTIASGRNSMAWGGGTEASNTSATSWGNRTTASGFSSTAWGHLSEAIGESSTAWGRSSEAIGDFSTSAGFDNSAEGYGSFVFGVANTASSFGETVLGIFSEPYSTNGQETWNQNDRLLVIGNGSSYTQRSNAMVILKNGNTGIGISEPDHLLTIPVTTKPTTEEADGQGIGIINTGSGNFWNIHMSNSWLRFSTNNETSGAHIRPDGEYVQNSDKRIKQNISSTEELLDKVQQIRVVTYQHKNDPEQTKKIGFIAQEMLSHFPELVFKDGDEGYYGINYNAFGAISIKAIQEQQAIIEQQHKTIKNLEKRIEEIEKLLEQ